MAAQAPVGWCPHCNQDVLLIKEPLDTMLAVILFCCTFGIGFFIYLLIFSSKKKNRCINCNSITLQGEYERLKEQISYQQPKQLELSPSAIIKFCPLCGGKLDKHTQNFCPHCGSKIE